MKPLRPIHRTLAFAAACIAAHGSSQAWEAKTHKDDFHGTAYTLISSTSKNNLNLAFPYQGKNKGSLTIVVDQDGTQSAILSIDKGQIVCPVSYCALAIKFGDKAPRNLVTKPSDLAGDYKSVTFSYPPALIEELAEAKDFTVRVEIFGQGMHDLVFKNNKPLDTSLIRTKN